MKTSKTIFFAFIFFSLLIFFVSAEEAGAQGCCSAWATPLVEQSGGQCREHFQTCLSCDAVCVSGGGSCDATYGPWYSCGTGGVGGGGPSPFTLTLSPNIHTINQGDPTPQTYTVDITTTYSGTMVLSSICPLNSFCSFVGGNTLNFTLFPSDDSRTVILEVFAGNITAGLYDISVSGTIIGTTESDVKSLRVDPPYIPPSQYNFHLVSRSCPSWNVLKGNEHAHLFDLTGGRYTMFTNYSPTPPLFPNLYSPLPVSTSEIPGSCAPLSNVFYTISTDSAKTQNVTNNIGPTPAGGEYVINFNSLSLGQRLALESGNSIWISENIPGGYQLGAHRCYRNGENGDNTEHVALSGDREIYCVSYNVPNPPIVSTGTIRGTKVKMPGNQPGTTPPSAETITLDGGSPTNSTPYNFPNLSAGNHTVSATVPSGYTVGYTLCYNDTTCHNNSPIAGNTVSVNVPSGGYADLWWHYTLSPVNAPPNPPTISGPSSGSVNTNYNFDFTASDPEANQIRYGIDWDLDNIADEWLPPGVTYVNSGTPQTTAHSWPSTGVKQFKALAQDAPGLNSGWSAIYNFSIAGAPVNGLCGPASKTYAYGVSTYGGDIFCSRGTLSPTPPPLPQFPPQGESRSWSCLGSGGGSPDFCTAFRNLPPPPTYSLNVTKSGQGTVTSTTNPSQTNINCGTICSVTLDQGTQVTLRATPATPNRIFTSWDGDCKGTPRTQDCQLTITGDKNVIANFSVDPTYKEF